MIEPNALELALAKAAADPEARADFYKMLMESDIFIAGQQQEADQNGGPIPVQFKKWQQPDGTTALPFFATEASLRQTLGPDEPAMTIAVVELFRLTRGLTLVLTSPDASKAFLPDEVETLLTSIMTLDPLAQALVRAAQENTDEAKQDFYNTLVNSQVFVLGKPKDETVATGDENRTMTESDQFLISSCPHPFKEGARAVPFFSSLEHLIRATNGAQTYLSFAALTFFSLAQNLGAPPILNPGFNPHKIFAPEELEFLLKTTRHRSEETRRFKPGCKIMLGAPEVYPQELVVAMLDFLPNCPQVKAAYLTAMREDVEGAEAILVIGFEAEGDLSALYEQAGELITQHAPEGLAVDFARIDKKDTGLSQHFLEKVSPFYLRPLNREKTPSKSSNGVADKESDQDTKVTYDQAGLLGRLKKIFSGSKKN